MDEDGSRNPKPTLVQGGEQMFDATLFLGSPSCRTGLVLHVHVWKQLHTDLTGDFPEDTRSWSASMLTQLVKLHSLDIRL